MALILVDAHTGWIDVDCTKSTSASETIRMVKKSFANFGVAKTVVSDNGPQFLSNEFNDWLVQIGTQHRFSPPYHPQSNGLEERAVRAFKKRERTLRNITDFQKRLDNVLVALNSGSQADMKMLGNHSLQLQ